jgi:protoporphyrinogen/coproporphyrinogen III oxidase
VTSDSVLADLAARAHERSVVVIGGGIAGLVAALECAKVGLSATLVEADERVGGVLRAADVAGIRLDVGAESFATRGGTVRELIDELGLGGDVVAPDPSGAWLAGLPRASVRRGSLAPGEAPAAPLPRGGVLGIPDNPWAPDVRRIIGWGGAWRAYLDRLRPPLTIGHERSLGRLVRTRMGSRVLERLVAPVTTGVYSARPDDIDVDLAAPGLNAALTRTGSLAGAVDDLRGGRTTAPGGAVQGIAGGMWQLADAVADRIRELGGVVRTGVEVTGLERDGDRWSIATSDETIAADAVIVATPERAARALLAAPVAQLDPADESEGPVVEVVTLVVDAPALDAAPRGTGVLTVPGTRAAKALTHSSVKWPWLAERLDPGVHVVRVSFGAQGEAPATEALSDEDAATLALAEVAALLGTPLPAAVLRGAHRERYVQSQPSASIGRAERTAAARGAIRAVDGVGAVGAWLSGTGLAQVVPDARREADRVRRAVLWGADAPVEPPSAG